jgi:putative endopeptidase
MKNVARRVVLMAILSTAAVYADAAEVQESGLEARWMDLQVRPQDDLYRHVSGHWLDTVEIPADRARYGAFDQLRDDTELRLKKIVEALAARTDLKAGTDEMKIADLYRDFMDEAALENAGIAPLKDELARIAAIASPEAAVAEMARLDQEGVGVPLGAYVNPDARESTRYAVYVTQSGLGMPDRDYYLNGEDARLKTVRERYLNYLERLFALAHHPDPTQAANTVLELETQLARAQWTKVENRDSIKTYNKVAFADLETTLSPDFEWSAWLKAMDLDGRTDYLIVRQPSYFKSMASLVRSVPLADWKTYLQARLLDSAAPFLDRDFVSAEFQFHGEVLRGIPQNRPRWKRGIGVVETALGEALGRLYVAEAFPESSKQRMQDLVNHLKDAFRESISTLPWMGPETRKAALEKLSLLNTKIGYPNRWRDYSALDIRRGDMLGNIRRASLFETQRELNKLGKPIDREEWGMTPQTVNAYYSPRMNEIVFPAAILQPPFFNPDADDAVNYGGIGAVIGHEISHAFDDQGSQSDGYGNLRNWWTDEDRARFKERTQALVQQYNAYSPLPGYFVNGELTLGENIADNSGLAVAWKAYHLALAGNAALVIDGLTGDQRFYSGWAQVWRSRARDAETIRLLKVDPHAPAAIRANGAVVNQPGFQAAFGTQPGDRLYRAPDQQVIIW